MKYIPVDKLIAEIKRLQQEVRNKWKENPRSSIDDGFLTACSRFLDIITSLQQEQPDLPSGEEVMTMCNQILIDWVKEGKTTEEVESREEAHLRFFELYDDYMMQEQPEVDNQ